MEQINNNSIPSELVNNNRLRVTAAEIETQLASAIAELQSIKTNTSRISQFQFQLAEDSQGTVFLSRYNTATGLVEALTLQGDPFSPVGGYNIVSSGGIEVETSEFIAITSSAEWQEKEFLTRSRFINTDNRTVVQVAWYRATGAIIASAPVIGTDVVDSDHDLLQKLAKLADAIVYDGDEARLRTFDVGLSDEVGSINYLWQSAISNAIRDANPQYRLITTINLAIATPNQTLYTLNSFTENCKTFLIHCTGFVENLEIFAHESLIYDNSMAFGVPYYSLIGNQSVNSSLQFTSDPDWIILNCPSRHLFIRTNSDFSVSSVINNRSLVIYAVDESLYSNALLGFLAENSRQALTRALIAEQQRGTLAGLIGTTDSSPAISDTGIGSLNQLFKRLLSNKLPNLVNNSLPTISALREVVTPFTFSSTADVFEQLNTNNYRTFCFQITGPFNGVILRSYQRIITGSNPNDNERETAGVYSISERRWLNFIDREGIYLLPIYGNEIRFRLQQITSGQVRLQGFLTADKIVEPRSQELDLLLTGIQLGVSKISGSVYYDDVDFEFNLEPSEDGSIIGGVKDCYSYKKAIIYVQSISGFIYAQVDGVITRVNIRNIDYYAAEKTETDVIGSAGSFFPGQMNVYDCDLYGSTFDLITDAQSGGNFVGRVLFTNNTKGEHIDVIESKIILRQIHQVLENQFTERSKGDYAKGYEIFISNDLPEIFIPANPNRLQLDIQNTGKKELNIYLLPANFIDTNPITNNYKCAIIKPDGSYTTKCFVGKVAINAGTVFDDANCLAHEISSEVIP